MLEHDVESVWGVLEAEYEALGDDHVAASKLGVRTALGPVLAGVDRLGYRHLLVRLGMNEQSITNATSENVTVQTVVREGTRYLSVVCKSRELFEVFAQFCREVSASVSESEHAANDVLVALAQWRRLFSERGRSRVLSLQERVGLFGELLMLRSIVRATNSLSASIWTGPSKSQHDFRALNSAIEVKATLSRAGRYVSISSIDQLQPPKGCDLYLAFYRLEVQVGELSLPDLITEILEMGVSAYELYSRLESCGFSVVDVDDYEDGFRIVESRIYRVSDEALPKVVRSSFKNGELPPGVDELTYTINLSNEPPIPLSTEQTDSLLKTMVSS